MADEESFDARVIREFRANGGVVPGRAATVPLLLLTTTGAKSGQQRTTPLVYTEDRGRLVIVASKGGAPAHPAWFLNLRVHPEVTVEAGAETFRARAVVAEGAERDRLFRDRVAVMPNFAEYQEKTPRVIPVVTLERIP